MIRGPDYEEAKWRVKVSHFTEQGYDIGGVVHVGANDGEEIFWYNKMGITDIIAFEPLTPAYEILCQKYPDSLNFKMALGNRNGIAVLQIAYGDGKGSSMLNPNLEHPEVKANWSQGQAVIVGKERIKVRKFATWVKEHPEIDLEPFDCLVLDTQGNELEVLMGMEGYLRHFKYLNIELSAIPIYDGEHSAQEVVDWLKVAGYTQDSPIVSHDDVFFIRQDIKPTSDMVYRGKA